MAMVHLFGVHTLLVAGGHGAWDWSTSAGCNTSLRGCKGFSPTGQIIYACYKCECVSSVRVCAGGGGDCELVSGVAPCRHVKRPHAANPSTTAAATATGRRRGCYNVLAHIIADSTRARRMQADAPAAAAEQRASPIHAVVCIGSISSMRSAYRNMLAPQWEASAHVQPWLGPAWDPHKSVGWCLRGCDDLALHVQLALSSGSDPSGSSGSPA